MFLATSSSASLWPGGSEVKTAKDEGAGIVSGSNQSSDYSTGAAPAQRVNFLGQLPGSVLVRDQSPAYRHLILPQYSPRLQPLDQLRDPRGGIVLMVADQGSVDIKMGEKLAGRRVSSAAIRSTSRRTRRALRVISSRLPIGVAQMKSFPLSSVT